MTKIDFPQLANVHAEFKISDTEKLELVDSILMQLDRPDPEIDCIWAEEARKRWQAYKSGNMETVAYDKVLDKYKNK